MDAPLDAELRFTVHDLLLRERDRRRASRKLAALTALYTGLRRQEIADLRREDVDRLHGKLYIRRRKKRSKSPIAVALPLNPRLQELFRQRREYTEKKRPQISVYYILSTGPKPVNPWAISVSFHRRVKREQLIVRTAYGRRYLRFHDLRHLFALRLLREAGNIEVVRRVLGHKNVRTTLQYLDLLPEDDIRKLLYSLRTFLGGQVLKPMYIEALPKRTEAGIEYTPPTTVPKTATDNGDRLRDPFISFLLASGLRLLYFRGRLFRFRDPVVGRKLKVYINDPHCRRSYAYRDRKRGRYRHRYRLEYYLPKTVPFSLLRRLRLRLQSLINAYTENVVRHRRYETICTQVVFLSNANGPRSYTGYGILCVFYAPPP